MADYAGDRPEDWAARSARHRDTSSSRGAWPMTTVGVLNVGQAHLGEFAIPLIVICACAVARRLVAP